MLELNFDDVEAVSGGNAVLGAMVGWGFGKLKDLAVGAIGNLAANGGVPDHGKTDALGNMY